MIMRPPEKYVCKLSVRSIHSSFDSPSCPLLAQENYFGEDDMYTDFEEIVSSPVLSTSTSSGLGWSPLGMEDSEQNETSNIHPLDLRPWDITVYINLYKVHGRLPMVKWMTSGSV